MKKIILTAASLILSCTLLSAQLLTDKLSVETENLSDVKSTISNSTIMNEAAKVQLAISNPDYRVTPGDIYGLAFVVGSNTLQYKIVVDSSYKIRVANLAVLDGTGKTFLTLKKQVEEIVSKNYPMSGVQFSLVTPAVFSVVVKGEVTETFEYNAWALTRLSSVLAENLTKYASSRNVTVTSAGGTSRTYDLFKAVRFGDMSQNPYLRPGDVITINPIERQVTVTGAVKREGIYELKEGENLIQLVEYYGGGFEELADLTRIEVTRIIGASDKTGSKTYLNFNSMDTDYELKNFDSVFIDTLKDRQPVMFIEGAIMQAVSENKKDEKNGFEKAEGSTKITVPFNYEENYAFLIKSRKDWFVSPVSDIKNAYIERDDKIIPIDIEKILYDPDFYCDIKVEPNDVLQVPFIQFYVSVVGCVHSPGRYPYVPNKTYDYYIGLAGGFDIVKNSHDSVKIKTIDGKKLSKKAVIPPEAIITAKANSFLFYFNQYAPVITTVLSIITSLFSVMVYLGVAKK